MRIAICDDEQTIRTRLHTAIDTSGILPCDAIISEFSDGTSLKDSHAKDQFNIIFLDIQMDGISGLEAGHEIRKEDKKVIIIFITSLQQYVFQSFKIEAFDYIVKPIDNDIVKTVLNRAISKYKEQHYLIHFKWLDNAYALDVSDIVYLEGYNRRITFVTKEREYYSIGKLKEYESTLLLYGFFRCHQGFIVNMNYIKSIEKKSITTVFGHTIEMSIRKKQDCLRVFSEFFSKHRM